jgi:hypothetical protein
VTAPGEQGSGDDPLWTWTIFWSPLDFPGWFVVRRFDIHPGEARPHQVGGLAASLAEAREMVPRWLHRFAPQPGDHPSVVETWF